MKCLQYLLPEYEITCNRSERPSYLIEFPTTLFIYFVHLPLSHSLPRSAPLSPSFVYFNIRSDVPLPYLSVPLLVPRHIISLLSHLPIRAVSLAPTFFTIPSVSYLPPTHTSFFALFRKLSVYVFPHWFNITSSLLSSVVFYPSVLKPSSPPLHTFFHSFSYTSLSTIFSLYVCISTLIYSFTPMSHYPLPWRSLRSLLTCV